MTGITWCTLFWFPALAWQKKMIRLAFLVRLVSYEPELDSRGGLEAHRTPNANMGLAKQTARVAVGRKMTKEMQGSPLPSSLALERGAVEERPRWRKGVGKAD